MLWRIVKTEFALIVQDDGWILNPENCTDNYLEYDYIGAPIHLAKIKEIRTTKEHWCRGFEWTKEINDPEKIITNVQNGGFSLRSMKMMRTLCEYNISIEIPPPSLFGGSNLTMEWYNDCLNEDVQLSGILRSRLEGLGLHYAPSSIARQFAIEHSSPILHKEFEYISLFGHHSKLRRLKSIEPLIVEYQISEQQIDNIYGERQIHDLFISLNYLIEYL